MTVAANQELYDWCAANCNGGKESSDQQVGGCAAGGIILQPKSNHIAYRADLNTRPIMHAQA
jgi:hypothetical protein